MLPSERLCARQYIELSLLRIEIIRSRLLGASNWSRCLPEVIRRYLNYTRVGTFVDTFLFVIIVHSALLDNLQASYCTTTTLLYYLLYTNLILRLSLCVGKAAVTICFIACLVARFVCRKRSLFFCSLIYKQLRVLRDCQVSAHPSLSILPKQASYLSLICVVFCLMWVLLAYFSPRVSCLRCTKRVYPVMMTSVQ